MVSNALQELKNRADDRILDIIGSYVALKKAGINYVGLCPFHDEKTPSFKVFYNSNRSFYHCFGCDAKGGVIEFLMKIENLTFPECCEKLKKYLNYAEEFKPKPPRISTTERLTHNEVNPEYAQLTFHKYESNAFVIFLKTVFDASTVSHLINQFFIGTTMNGGTIFWIIDENQEIRTGQIIMYNSVTGKRRKNVNIHWIHSLAGFEGFVHKLCFFGQHQLEELDKPVAIVESPKTAVIMSAVYPNYIWLASCGATQLQIAKFEILKDREIILFPDYDKYEHWQSIMWHLVKMDYNITIDATLLEIVDAMDDFERNIYSKADIADVYLK